MSSYRLQFANLRRRVTPAAWVFAVALLARLFVLYRAADTFEFLPNQGDMKFYSDWARRILGGAWTDHHAFYGLPGYAYWLALIYKGIGIQPYVVSTLQAVIEACTATLIYLIAPLAFVPAKDAPPAQMRRAQLIGMLAAAGWVLCPSAQAFSLVLMPTCYLVCAFWYVVWWILRARPAGRPSLLSFFGLGLLMGLVAMAVANILFLVPLVLAAIFIRGSWRQPDGPPFPRQLHATAAALVLGGVGLGILPCALHNYLAAGEPVLLSAHSGINFYLGNNAQANGFPQIPPPLHADQEGMLRDSITWAEKSVGHPLTRAEVSRFWTQLAQQYIREHPLGWLRLLAVKFGNFWNDFQYDDLGILSAFREDGVLLPGFGFGFAAMFGLPGLLLAAWRLPRSRWVVAAVLLHLGSLMTVFVTERYRLAALPGLLLLGSYGLVEIVGELFSAQFDCPCRRWIHHVAYAFVLALAAVMVHRPVDPDVRFIDDYNSALTDIERNNLDRAQTKLERVVHGHPDAESFFALGNVWLARGNDDHAKACYRRTLQYDPRHYRALNNLGVIAVEEKQWPVAELFLAGALVGDPDDAKAHYLLAQVRAERGNLEGANSEIQRAVHLRPDRPEFQLLRDEIEARRERGPASPDPGPTTAALSAVSSVALPLLPAPAP